MADEGPVDDKETFSKDDMAAVTASETKIRQDMETIIGSDGSLGSSSVADPPDDHEDARKASGGGLAVLSGVAGAEAAASPAGELPGPETPGGQPPRPASSQSEFKVPVIGLLKATSVIISPVNKKNKTAASGQEGQETSKNPESMYQPKSEPETTLPSTELDKEGTSSSNSTLSDKQLDSNAESFIEPKSEPVLKQYTVARPPSLPTSNKELPADKQVKPASEVPVPYLEPSWGGQTERGKTYTIEILKNGKIVNTIKLNEKSFYVIGRLPAIDITMEHPSVSRYHAVLQYCAVTNDRHDVGWYVYDLDSTHGTWINKAQVKPRVYYHIRVGHVVKFGGSTRLFILEGPQDDAEEESELSVTEMIQLRESKKREKEIEEVLKEEKKEEEENVPSGCSWGMTEDAVDPEAENPFAELLPQNEDLYLDDPKKCLKGFFEREGYDLPEYTFEAAGHGKHKCTVELPIDSPTGQPVHAEAVVTGKRKDAVVACALEACRILDRYQLLRKKEQEAKKVKTHDWEENDFYGSDEDEFLDRTGTIQKKREMRMKRAGKLHETVETYDSLVSKLGKVEDELHSIEDKLEKAKKESKPSNVDDLDALDAYMTAIKEGAMDTKTRMALKRQMFDLRKEQSRLQRLVNIAKPASLPTLKSSTKPFAKFGRIGGLAHHLKKTSTVSSAPKAPVSAPVASAHPTDVEEKEEVEKNSEDEDDKKKKSTGNSAETKIETDSCIDNTERKPEPIKSIVPDPGQDRAESGDATAELIQQTSDSQVSIRLPTEDVSTSEAKNKPSTAQQELSGSKNEDLSSKTKHQVAPKSVPTAVIKRIPNTEKRPLGPKPKKPKPDVELSKDYNADDPDYAWWMPPKGQTGDGKTHLNAKFGY